MRIWRWQAAEPILVFAPEWLCVAALVLLDSQIAPLVRLHFSLSWHDANLICLPLLGLAILTRKWGGIRAGLTMEFSALILAAAPALVMLIYIGAVTAGPLWDKAFLAADHALGFDWLAWFHYVTARPWLSSALKFLYWSPNFQAFYFCILMGITGNVTRLREMFWLVSLTLILTALGSWIAPTLGPFGVYNLRSLGPFVVELEKLREGLPIYRDINQMQGIVQFPSFHTTVALMMIYGFRGTGVIGWLIATADLLMLLGVPVFGGHYLVDMLAGALVFALALIPVWAAPSQLKRLPRVKPLAAASP